ncbi:uncharacterized protein LOC111630556 [Centruroides sculpturatus]|uniref:uncharacterized protein LOC111630556 n=1 Tax=Centruroides sculpturatus TaxID=218467 RepID=UPI000C6CE9DC|nr:uncharacterized protein LOC111630556 [Centruroides sculpturatus]
MNTMFPFDSPVVTLTLKDTEHSVCLDTILQCHVDSKLVKVLRNNEEVGLTDHCVEGSQSDSRDKSKRHRYVELPEEQENFAYVYPFLLHFLKTKHLMYPRDKDVVLRFVQALEYFDVIKDVRELFVAKHARELTNREVTQVLLEGSIKIAEQKEETITDLEEFNYVVSKRVHRESLIAVTRIREDGKRFAVFTVYGQHKTLKEMFPDKEVEEDFTYRNLTSLVRLGSDLRNDGDLVSQLGSVLLYSVMGRLGFGLTCYSTFYGDEKDIFSGLWLFYRERPGGGRTRKIVGLSPGKKTPEKSLFPECCLKRK